MSEPLVTVALQFFNCRRTLESAIASITMQTFPGWELILHDDGSTDGSGGIAAGIRDKRVKLLSSPLRRGRPTCINEAIGAARGRYFALMDGDDIAYPERLEREVTFLERNPDVDLVGAPELVFGRDGGALGKRPVPLRHDEICRKPWAGFPLFQPTFFGKTEWFRTYRYDALRRRAQDQELLLRSHTMSRFANLPEILLGYREESISLRKSLFTRTHLAVAFSRELARRKHLGLAARAVAGQAAKGAVDAFAVVSGLGYRVLRHRARPLSESEKARWREVWTLVMDDGSDAV